MKVVATTSDALVQVQCPESGALIDPDKLDGSGLKRGPCSCGKQYVCAEPVEGSDRWAIEAHRAPNVADLGEIWARKLGDVLASQTFPAREAENESNEFWAMVAFMAGVPVPVRKVRDRAVYLGELAELERNEFAAADDGEAWARVAVEDGVEAMVEARCERQEAGLF